MSDEWPEISIPDEDPSPRLFTVYQESFVDGPTFRSAQELADAFGAPIFEPTLWPEGASPPSLAIRPTGPEPGPPVSSYRMWVTMPTQETTPFVYGTFAPSPHEAGVQGWYGHPDLTSMRGIAHWDVSAHVIVEREGQRIHIAMFPSVSEAVRTALSLRRVAPSI